LWVGAYPRLSGVRQPFHVGRKSRPKTKRIEACRDSICQRALRRATWAPNLMVEPKHIEIIGAEVAIRWNDGMESFFPAEFLRANSPSAENVGERDLFGRKMGGSNQRTFPGVIVTGWERVGNYAIRFDFSDGHRTGLYIFDYLRELSERLKADG
jgi:DUF971 family protein